MKHQRLIFLLSGTVMLAPAAAQDSFALAWSSISGGGGASTGPADFTLAGTSVGQFAAGGNAGKPGEFTVSGGYWTFPFDSAPDLHLAMSLAGGTVTLTWDAGGPPVILESSDDMELWMPVDPQPVEPFFQEPESARKFYRLAPP